MSVTATERLFASGAALSAGEVGRVGKSSAAGDAGVKSAASVALEPCAFAVALVPGGAGWTGFLLPVEGVPQSCWQESAVSAGLTEPLETNLVERPLLTGSSLPAPAESV